MSPADYLLATSADDLKHAMTRLAGRPLLALDLETEGLDPHRHRCVLLCVGDADFQLLVDCRKTSIKAQ